MTTLGDFGADVPEPDQAPDETASAGGRCIALTSDGTRCSHESVSGRDVCHVHIPDARESIDDILTIRSPPRQLIRRHAWSAGQCRAKYTSRDERCTAAVRPLEVTCRTHTPVEEFELVPPERQELQWEWIEAALQALDAETPAPAPVGEA